MISHLSDGLETSLAIMEGTGPLMCVVTVVVNGESGCVFSVHIGHKVIEATVKQL